MPLASMSNWHLDLRHAARRGRNAVEDEAAQRPVILRQLALALQHVDLHARLAIAGGREDLALLRRDRRVALDQLGGDATERLDAERERRHVQQQHIAHVAGQHARLDGRADRDHLIRVDALIGSLSKMRLTVVTTAGMRVMPPTSTTSSICDDDTLASESACSTGLARLLDQVVHQLLELGAGERHRQVLRAGLSPR